MKNSTKKFIEQYHAWRIKTSALPAYAVPKKKFDDSTSGGLAKMVQAAMRMYYDCEAWVIDVKGTYRDGKWIPTQCSRGVSDIITCYKGIMLCFEIKIGGDVQSEDQKKFEAAVLYQGGFYFIIKNFEDFLYRMTQVKRLIDARSTKNID